MNELTLEWVEAERKHTQKIYSQQPTKNPGTVRIGRDAAQCDIVLSHPTVSRLHVEIFFHEQRCFRLRNLRMTNSPIVDGQRLQLSEVELRPNSTIYLGEMQLKVVDISVDIAPTIAAPQRAYHVSERQGIETLSGVWSSAVRLETGDIIAFEKIHINIVSSSGYLYGTASFHGDPLGGIEGSQQGNHFGFRLTYNGGTNALQNRNRTEIEFVGNIGDNQAAGAVRFTDEYRKVFNGTFIMVPYNFNVTPPTPSVPDSSSNAIQGAWKGEFLPKNHSSYPLTLNLNHQSTPIMATKGGYYNGANIVGTGTIQGKTYQVEGTIAGSSYNLVMGDSSTRLDISGQVTQDALVGGAKLNTGEEVVPGVYKRFGEVKLTR